VKAIVQRLDGISTGVSMAVLSLDPNVTDDALVHISQTILSLCRFVIGPIHRKSCCLRAVFGKKIKDVFFFFVLYFFFLS
jgi:hypothetical protein